MLKEEREIVAEVFKTPEEVLKEVDADEKELLLETLREEEKKKSLVESKKKRDRTRKINRLRSKIAKASKKRNR